MKNSEFVTSLHEMFNEMLNKGILPLPNNNQALLIRDPLQVSPPAPHQPVNSLETPVSQPSKLKDVFYGSNGWNNRGRWVIQKFLKVGKVGIFAGASQSFKTFALLRICLCVANGRPIGGHKIEQSDVHYVAAEGSADIAMRLHALEKIHGSVGDRISFSHRSLDLRDSEDIAFMKEVLEEHETRTGNKIRLLILDTLSQSARGLEENSAKEVSNLIGACADFGKQHNLAIILVHHLGKDGKIRGSSAFEGNLDFIWQAERIRSTSTLATKMLVKKNKDGLSNIGFKFNLESFDTGIYDQWGEAETTLRVRSEFFIVDDGESNVKS